MNLLQTTIKKLLVVPLAFGLPLGALHAAPQYIISDMGTLGGVYSSGIAINEAGQVAGYSHLPSNAALHPFLGQPGSVLQDLNTLGGTHAMALGINSSGQVVGNSQITGDTTSRGFVWNVNAMLPLSTLGGTRSRATAINDNGVMTGAASLLNDTAEHGVVWPTSLVTSPTDLGTLGGVNSQGNDINVSGQVVGYAENAAGQTHATRWVSPYNSASRLDLGTLGGTYSEAYGINTAGQVTGISSITGDTQYRGFVWQATQGMVDLGTLTPTSTHTAGIDINTNGDVVGYSTTVGGAAKRAIIRKTGVALADLNGQILPNTGWVLSEAHAINDAGQIVGIGTLTKVDVANNLNRVEHHAFLLTPDKINPTITCPGTVITTGQQPASIGTAIVADNLDPTPTVTNNKPATFPNGSTTVIWTVTDANSNSATCSQLVTINADTTPPVVALATVPATPNPSGWFTVAPRTSWSVTDAESAIISRTGCATTAAQTNTAPGGRTLSCTATSTGGTTGPITQLIKVDTTLPTLTGMPVNSTVAATSLAGAVVTYTAPTAADTFSGVSAAGVSCLPDSGATLALGSNTVTCTVSDVAGNSTSASFVVTVEDQSPPDVSFVIAPAAPSATGWYRTSPRVAWTVADGQSPITSPDCVDVPSVGNTLGQSFSCSATSAGGTTGPVVTPLLKVDRAAPTLAGVPLASTITATSAAGAVVTYSLPTATDAISGVSAAGVSCLPASGATLPVGDNTISCSASDIAGNTATASFVVTVADQSPPDVSFAVAPAAPNATGWYRTSPSVTWTVSDAQSAITSPACVDVPSVGNTLGQSFSCSATSAGGTTGPITTPLLKVDATAPTLAGVPLASTTTATSAAGAVVTYTLPTATDALSGVSAAGVSCLPASGATLPVGVNTISCSASDIAGNTASASFSVTVNAAVTDSTPPQVSVVIAPAAANGLAGWYTTAPSVTWSASDAQSAITSPACDNVPAVGNTLGQSFSCSATSTGGTTNLATPVIKVDTTNPTIAVPASFTRAATSAAGAVVTYTTPTATDTFSGVAGVVSCLPASGTTLPLGATTVTCSARDVADNSNSASFVVTVADQTAPVFTSCPATVTLTQGQTLPLLVATDNVSTPVVSRTPAGTLGLGTTAVTWTATDQAGLSANCLQQVIVNAAVTETFTTNGPQCKRRSATTGEWTVRGTSSIRTNNTIQLYTTATVPTTLTSNRLGGLLTVSTTGNWQYSSKTGPACSTRISLRSAGGTVRENIAVSVN